MSPGTPSTSSSRIDLRELPGIIDPHSISYSAAGAKLAFTKATVRQNIRSYPLGPGTVSVADGRSVTSENAVIEEHDISPDGRWIAYDQNRRGTMDIYRRLLEGGTPMPVTSGAGDEFAPKWSPDGTEIAFYSNREGRSAVEVVAADGGTPVQLASGMGERSQPRWSPDGLSIALTSDQTGQYEVWLVLRDTIGAAWGDAMRQLTDFGCITRDWAPDGSGVLCVSGAELALVSRDGEVAWRYPASAARMRGYGWNRYSRNGSTLYFYAIHEDGSEGIWAMPARGGEPRLVVAFDDPEAQGLYMFSVGPDRLYVTVREVHMDIWVADLEVER